MKALYPLMFAWLTILFIIAVFIVGRLTVDTQKYYQAGAQIGYDKGYVAGRLETEETMRSQISECVTEDWETMVDCMQEL